MKKDARSFIGVDLGGGKGKNTAVARLELDGDGLKVTYNGTDKGFDDQLIPLLLEHAGDAIVAIDAPLTLPSCVRCVEPTCPTLDACEVPIVAWFRAQANGALKPGTKPKYTPYTQRASEVVLHDEHQILPRETLGQGMGPLTARGQYLTRALRSRYQLNENLIEVYPKATLTKLFPEDVAQYKRSARSRDIRLRILNKLSSVLTFAPGQWREHAIDNDHKFDAIICAYTAYLWWRDECVQPPSDVVREDGWIWFPKSAAKTA
jgi:predicted RNase H-like nuclease